MNDLDAFVGQAITRVVCESKPEIRAGLFHLETPVGTLRIVWFGDHVQHAVIEPPAVPEKV